MDILLKDECHVMCHVGSVVTSVIMIPKVVNHALKKV